MKDTPEIALVRKELPEKRRAAKTLRRLLELAKKAPFAAANEDFLSMVEQDCEQREAVSDIAERLIETMDLLKKGADEDSEHP